LSASFIGSVRIVFFISSLASIFQFYPTITAHNKGGA
jgi:hypothetical protein